MQFSTALIVAFAASVLANCDGDSCSSTTIGTDSNGVLYTSVVTTTDVGKSTTLVPLYTQSVLTTTDVGVSTTSAVIPKVTNLNTVATNTLTQYTTNTNVHLASGYTLVTSSDKTYVSYTGTGTPPAGGAYTTSSSGFAVATAVPMLGAAAMAGLAFVL